MVVDLSHDLLSLPCGETRLVRARDPKGLSEGSIVFFPGVGDSARNYSTLVAKLASRGLRACAVEPPGYGLYGEGAPPSFDVLMTEWAPAVCAAIDRPKLLVGHGSGAALATAGAASEQERGRVDGQVRGQVRGLVWIGWSLLVETLPRLSAFLPKDDAELEHLLEHSWSDPPKLGRGGRRVMLARLDDEGARAHSRSLDPAAWLERLAAYDGPTLLVAGEDDGMVPVASVLESQARLPGSRVELLSACGHYPHRERPSQLRDLLLAYAQERFVPPDDLTHSK